MYRGAYPTLKNFRFLTRLKLKTVISIVPRDLVTLDLVQFCEGTYKSTCISKYGIIFVFRMQYNTQSVCSHAYVRIFSSSPLTSRVDFFAAVKTPELYAEIVRILINRENLPGTECAMLLIPFIHFAVIAYIHCTDGGVNTGCVALLSCVVYAYHLCVHS